MIQTATTASLAVRSGILNATLFHRREHHGGVGKELLPVPLDKGGRGRADADDQVERLFGKERTQILDERSLRVFIAGTGASPANGR